MPLSLKVAEGFVFVESNRKVIFAADKDGNVRWVANDIVKLSENTIIISLRNRENAKKLVLVQIVILLIPSILPLGQPKAKEGVKHGSFLVKMGS